MIRECTYKRHDQKSTSWRTSGSGRVALCAAIRRAIKGPVTPLPVLLLFAAGAYGQQPASSNTPPPIDQIVVTGTATGTTIRGVAPVGSQSIEIDRLQLETSPVRNPAAIISMLPQGSQLGSSITAGDGGNNAGNAGINLRGLGTHATLMLLDGHRMVGQGVSEIMADPSMIPFLAVQQVEVVMGGASSIYGSDAIAGVVNFKLRNQFDGISLKASHQAGLRSIDKVGFLIGHTYDKVNFLVGLSYSHQDPLAATERPYFMDDLRRYGGNDNRVVGRGGPSVGAMPVIDANNQYYGVPKDFNGVVDPITGLKRPTLSAVKNTQPVFKDSAYYKNYLAEVNRQSVLAKVQYDITDTLRLSYTGLYSKREAENRVTGFAGGVFGVTVTPNSPYYIPGLAPIDHRYTVYVNTSERGFNPTSAPWAQTQNHFIDIQKDFGAWRLYGTLMYGATKGADIHRPERNSAALTDDPAGTPAGYKNYADYGNDPGWFNPYLWGDQAGMMHLLGMTYRIGNQSTKRVKARMEGPLVELPGGQMRLSAGVAYEDTEEWMGLYQTVRYYDKRVYWLHNAAGERQISSAFMELYMPVISGVPGIQRLTFDVSVRADDYSDFGSTTNPRLSLTWDVNDSVSVRGAAATAFRAPTLTQINPDVNSTLTRSVIDVAPGIGVPITDPLTGGTKIFDRSGRSADLGPETAEMWSLGIDYTPEQVPGFRLGATYYDVTYEDRIESLPNSDTALSSAANFAIYKPFWHPYTQPATCVPGQTSTYSPVLQKFIAGADRFAGGPEDCETVGVLNTALSNLGTVHQAGVDFNASYRWDTSIGSWQFSTRISKILDLNRTLIDGGKTFDVLDVIGWQTSLRALTRLSWFTGNWGVTLLAKTEGSYLNDQTPTVGGTPLPDQHVPSWTTFDATVGYTVPVDSNQALAGFEFRLGITNLTDKDPPIVLNGSSAFDPNVHNPFGRLIRLSIKKTW